MSRYQRQSMLPEIGDAGQQALHHARVLVVGAGGLGATLLPLLAGAGVGYLRIYDGDRVEEHNLHRQTLFGMGDIGNLKAVCAQQALYRRNPECVVDARPLALSASRVAEALEGIDLAIDAADNFAVTYLLSDTCLPRRIPLVSASVLGRQGYVGLLRRSTRLPCTFPAVARQRSELQYRRGHGAGGGDAGRASGSDGTQYPARIFTLTAWLPD